MKFLSSIFIFISANTFCYDGFTDLKPLWKDKEYFQYCRCWMIESHVYQLQYLIEQTENLTYEERMAMYKELDGIHYNIAWKEKD